MWRLVRLLRSGVALIWLCAALAVSTVTLGVQALALSAQVATLTAGAAASALKHRQEMNRAIAKARAKARLRRMLVAVPFVGGGAALAFEARDYQVWQAENPDATFSDYSCDVAELSAEVVDEVLQDLPIALRPDRDLLLRQLDGCPDDASAP